MNIQKTFVALALGLSLFASGVARADAPAAGTCETKAVGKDGKPLAGAAKTAFMKKCEKNEATAKATTECEGKALSKDGKPLAGAAKSAFVKKCVKDATAAK